MCKQEDNKTIYELLEEGKIILKNAGISEYEQDAYLLLEHVTGLDRMGYIASKYDLASEDVRDRYMSLIADRSKRIPLQHIIGYAYFYGLRFKVNDKVLIPRFDTENLVECALEIISELEMSCSGKITLLDMCTGSGCIAISIKDSASDVIVSGVDISSEALLIAEENQKLIARDNGWKDNISFIQSNLFEQVDDKERFDIIVSNPPYIDHKDIEQLEPEVRDYDPALALFAEDSGLDYYKKITSQANKYLNNGGYLLYEIGYNQADSVKAIMRDNGFLDIKIIQDLSGLDRVLVGHI